MDSLTLLTNRMQWNAQPAPGVLNGTRIHVGWVNFLDSAKKWAEIDCLLKSVLSGFEVEKAPFYFKAPKRSTGYAEFNVTNRFDVFKKSEITAPGFNQVVRCLGIEDVSGKLFDISGNGRKDAVIYPGAYASTFTGDLVYFVEHGRAPRLKKLVRFNVTPSSDIAIQFELEYGSKAELSPRKLLQGISRVQYRDLWKTNLGKGDKLYLHSVTNKNEGLYVRAWDEPQKRGIGIKQPLIWDSNPDPFKQKIQKVETYIERIGINKYRLTKIIPKSFFTDAVFPVYTDTTSTFYPDPDPETNTVDGYIGYHTGWSTIHDASVGTVVDDSGANCRTGGYQSSWLFRSVFLFDTSSIDIVDAIISAKFSAVGVTATNEDNDGDDFYVVVQTQGQNLGSDTSLALDDYDQVGDAISNPTEGSNRIDGTGMGGRQDFILDATGRGWIAKNGEQKPAGATAGITYLGNREGHDVLNSPLAEGKQNNIYWRSVEISGSVNDPYLEVVHGEVAGELGAVTKSVGFLPIQIYGSGVNR